MRGHVGGMRETILHINATQAGSKSRAGIPALRIITPLPLTKHILVFVNLAIMAVEREPKFDIELVEEQQDQASQSPPTDAELKAVRLKVDLRLMPIMVLTYAIQYYGNCVLSGNRTAAADVLENQTSRF